MPHSPRVDHRQRSAKTLAALALAALVGPALAGPVTFGFAGKVTDDPFGLSSFGAPISGSFTFDNTVSDSITSAANGSYSSVGAGFGFTSNVDGTGYTIGGSLTVNVANSIFSGDQYGAIGSAGDLTLELFFQDATGTALSSDALPTAPPAFSAFDLRQFRLFSSDAEFLGSVDSLVCLSGCRTQTVPEPGSWALALLALALAARVRANARGGLRSIAA